MQRKSAAPAKSAKKPPKRTAKAPAEASTGLTDIERTFVDEYLKDLNGQQAYLRVRPNVKSTTAKVEASKLLTRPNVAAYLELKMRKRSEDCEVSAERALLEAARLAFVDIRRLVDKDGRLIPLHLLDEQTAAAVQSVELSTTGLRTVKYKLADKNSALERLFKHLGMFDLDNKQRNQPLAKAVSDFLSSIHSKGGSRLPVAPSRSQA